MSPLDTRIKEYPDAGFKITATRAAGLLRRSFGRPARPMVYVSLDFEKHEKHSGPCSDCAFKVAEAVKALEAGEVEVLSVFVTNNRASNSTPFIQFQVIEPKRSRPILGSDFEKIASIVRRQQRVCRREHKHLAA